MRVYDPNRACAKCGSTDVATAYHSRPPSRMERACRRCLHFWFEKPLDSVEKSLDVSEAPAAKGIGTEDKGTKGIGIFRLNPRD